jgi:phospholipid N-methyltransferase
MNKLDFIIEGIRNLKTVGSLTPSSSYLCRAMIEPIDFQKSNVIVELGPGDGVITEYILNAMNASSTLLAFEVNESFCDLLMQKYGTDNRFRLVADSAEKIEEHLNKHGFESVDYVVSAIPFSILPDELARAIILEAKRMLKPGGLFIQFHYSPFTRKHYNEIFDSISTNFVPLNLPPAFVLSCLKK